MTDNPLKNEDFEAIEAAVMETARGRWFLAEHARRQRLAEAAGVFDAIKSLEERLAAQAFVPAPPLAPAPDMGALSRLVDEAYDHVLTAFGVTKSKASDGVAAQSRAEAARLAAETLRDLRTRMHQHGSEAVLLPGQVRAIDGAAEIDAAADVSVATMPTAIEEPEIVAAVVSAEIVEDDAVADKAPTALAEAPVQEDPLVEEDLFGDASTAEPQAEAQPASETRRPDNHEHLATTLRAAIAQVRGPSSDIDALSFEAKSVLFA